MNVHDMNEFNFNFNFTICKTFSEKKNISANKWFKKLKWKFREIVIRKVILFKKLLNTIEFLFTNDAVDWTEINFDVINIFFNSKSDFNSVVYFKNLFQKRFFIKSSKINQINFDSELQNFRQRENEFLLTYYKRILFMMQRIEVKNKSTSEPNILLNFLKIVMFDFIIKIFIRKLIDDQVKLNFTKMLIFSERFFREMYILAEKFRRIKKKFQKFKDEQIKQKKLNLLKNVIQRNMTSIQIQIFRTLYHNKNQFYFFRSNDRHRIDNDFFFHTDVNSAQFESVYQHFFSPQINISYQSFFSDSYQSVFNFYSSVNHYQSDSNFYQFYQSTYQSFFSESELRSDQQQFELNQQFLSEFSQSFYEENNSQYSNSYIFFISSYQFKQSFQKSDFTQSWFDSNQNRESSQNQNSIQNKNKLQKISKKIYSFFNIEKLFDKSEFKNLYVNEIKIWKYEMNFFCIICEELNHITKNCQKKN